MGFPLQGNTSKSAQKSHKKGSCGLSPPSSSSRGLSCEGQGEPYHEGNQIKPHSYAGNKGHHSWSCSFSQQPSCNPMQELAGGTKRRAGCQIARIISVHRRRRELCQGKVPQLLWNWHHQNPPRPIKSSIPSGNDSAPSLPPPFIFMDLFGSIKNTQEKQRGP